MHHSSSNSFSQKAWKGSISALIVTLGLLSIVATGGGGGGNGDEPGVLQFSASSYSGNEDAGDITVTVTRTGGSDGAATVDVSDASSGTATSGADYTAITTTTLSWADGDSGSKTINVSVIADGAVEPNETVGLALGNATGAPLGSTTATTVTILNDDVAGPGTLQFNLSNYSGAEGDGNATITVTRTGGDTGAVGVSYATSDGTATAGNDYTAASSTLSWADTVSGPLTFQVPIIDDTDVEVPETVNLTLSLPTGGATLGTPNTATLTITSEDRFGTLQFSATSYNVDETDGAVSNVITLQRVNGSSGLVTVDVSDLGTGSATGSGTDYTLASPTTVTWGDGITADQFVTITLIDDGDSEGTETVNLSLGNVAGGASLGTPSAATVNIADDEAPPAPGELQFDSSSYSVSEEGVTATITVNRINGSLGAVGISYATSDGTATIVDGDYTAASGTLSWGDGETTAKSFTVAITNDTKVEGDETVSLALSSPTGGATLGSPSTATLIIDDDDDTNLTMDIGDGSFWVAFQDGPSGTWTEWSPTSANTYDFPVTDGSGRYGVAFHRQETDGLNTVEKTYVIHATVGELASLNAFRNTPYTVSGTLSNYTGINDAAVAAMHTWEDGVSGFIPDPYVYTLPRIPAGTRDFFAAEVGLGINFVIRRNINVTGNLVNQDVDFTNDGDVETATGISNNFSGSSAGEFLEVYFATANGTSFFFASETYDGVTPVGYPYLTNASLTQAGDVYSFQISSASGSKYKVRNKSATTDPGNRTMGLDNLVNLTGTAVSTTQTTGLSYTPDPTSQGGSPVFRGFQIGLDQTVVGIDGGAHWQIKISAGWLGTSTTYTHPALSSISGYSSGWDMSSGTLTNATVSTATTNSGTGLSLITRKTMGRNSNNLQTHLWVVAKKLAQKDTLKLDIANQFSTFTW